MKIPTDKSNPNSGLMLITTALMCEARPLIDEFKLKKITTVVEFPIFISQDKSIFLIVSGIGKINSASAVSFLYALTGLKKQAYLCNIGIAGSSLYKIGDLIIANKVVDQASSRSLYPSLNLLPKKYKIDCLVTVDVASLNYFHFSMIDMEAFGFYLCANRLVVKEQIQVIKIISDNPTTNHQALNAKLITQLIEDNLSEIKKLIELNLQISAEEFKIKKVPSIFFEITSQAHFTCYQQHELQEILRRYHASLPQENILEILANKKTAKEIISMLKQQLASVPYYL